MINQEINKDEDFSLPGLGTKKGEIYGPEHLEIYAGKLAATHILWKRRRGYPLLRRVAENGVALSLAQRSIVTNIQADRSITLAAEWLVDNFHIVEEQLREIRNLLPPAYYRDLPKLATGELSGYPRVYGVVCGFVSHTDSRLDADLLSRYIRAYQFVEPLTMGELWAIAITLRVVLIENLRRHVDWVVGGKDARVQADKMADSLLGFHVSTTEIIAEIKSDWKAMGTSPYFSAFAVQLLHRLQDQVPTDTEPLDWLNQQLGKRSLSSQGIIRLEHQHQAALNVSVRNIITSMRMLQELDWKDFFEANCLTEEILRKSTGYAEMDFSSRDLYRHEIERLSRRSKHSENEIAVQAVKKISEGERDSLHADLGYFLLGDGQPLFEKALRYRSSLREKIGRTIRENARWIYPVSVLLLTCIFLRFSLNSLRHQGLHNLWILILGGLFAIPLSEGALALVNRFILALMPPRLLPKLDFSKGVPVEFWTLVVVPAMVRNMADVRELMEKLEVHYLANPDGYISFALLTDGTDAPTENMPQDEPIEKAAKATLAELNLRYGKLENGANRFMLFHRRRLWNPSEGKWMGWERKRGKLAELNKILSGDRNTSFIIPDQQSEIIPTGIRYVITLDSDTRLPKGEASRMAGCMAHPLNRPRFDAKQSMVIGGYGILQPRVVPALPVGADRTLFHWVTSGPCGIDPYAGTVSDVYQDLYDQGSFSGKGIYDVQAFEAALKNRIPENTLLSHDLFEGSFARCGLLTDVEVLEDFPSHYQAYSVRQHRWVRGDWQLLPWILNKRPLPFLGRLKMIDNLRRSLVSPFAFLSLAVGWLVLPDACGAWTVLVLLALGIPDFVSASEAVVPPMAGVDKKRFLRDMAESFMEVFVHFFLAVVLLAHQAWLILNSISKTLVRLCFTRKHLLEWVTMAQAASEVRSGVFAFYRIMPAPVLLTLPLGGLIWYLKGRTDFLLASPLLGLWVFSPYLAYLASTSQKSQKDEVILDQDRIALRKVALRTWRFFHDFSTKRDNFLPPDNFQEDPVPVVAHRTSPTNIGLGLLSIATARDFGWVGITDCLERLEAVFNTLGKLERYRGHFFNWYGTTDLRALEPKYISTVDSGNLAGHLVTLKQTCHEYLSAPIFLGSLETGLIDLMSLFKESVLDLPENLRTFSFGRKHLLEAIDKLQETISPIPVNAFEWVHRLSAWELHTENVMDLARSMAMELNEPTSREVESRAEFFRTNMQGICRDIRGFFPNLELLSALQELTDLGLPETFSVIFEPMSLNVMEDRCLLAVAELRIWQGFHLFEAGKSKLLQTWASDLALELERMAFHVRRTTERLVNVMDRCAKFYLEMDFSFLLDNRRKLFAIGYRPREEVLDQSFYDLLASEARLTSFIAIAKGDVLPSHWFRLGRTLTQVGKGATLLSWSGSMFEYLMPRLVMRSPTGSLLEYACRYAVRRQIEYGKAQGIPWGISEAAYNIRDVEMTYQYSSFGVPGLGLKRGLSEDLVVAPYATALAAMINPKAAILNFASLREQGAEGRYGFYESIDYTRTRLQDGQSASIVKSYFAHHQGMALVALADVLLEGSMQNRFHSDPFIRAADPLLQERTPKGVTLSRANDDEVAKPIHVESPIPEVLHRFSSVHEPIPRSHILSNGRYTVMITTAGSGFSRWRGQAITRWREDAVLDNYGQYLYLRDPLDGNVWSATYQPTAKEPDALEAVFSEDRAELTRRDGDIASKLEIVVSSEDDAEVRRLTLENLGEEAREIEVTSYMEIVIAPHDADLAHPAFSNLFIRTEFAPQLGALLANRRPRSSLESPIWAAHVCGIDGEVIGGVQFETDRAKFLGRGHTLRGPISIIDGKPLSNTVGPVLDPVFSLRYRVRIPSGGKVKLVFTTLTAGSREDALSLADKYREPEAFERVATLAWTQAHIQLRHFGIGSEESRLYQRLANRLFFLDPSMRPPGNILELNRMGQESLWKFGISGDLPIVLATYDEAGDRNLAKDLLKAHAYLEMKRLDVDLVLVNDNPESYLQHQQAELEGVLRMRRDGHGARANGTRGAVFLLRRDQLSKEEYLLLQASSRAVLVSRRGSLADQVLRMRSPGYSPHFRKSPLPAHSQISSPPNRPKLEFFNGLGGFGNDGREYHIILDEGQWTPAPWVNVVANPQFGFIATESGSGYTWSGNSRECKLTTWSNDPVGDTPSEIIYIRDCDSGEIWSPTALPIREKDGLYEAVHGQGYTRYAHTSHGIRADLIQWVPLEDNLKLSLLTLENTSDAVRNLDVTFFAEWVLGMGRGLATQHLKTQLDSDTGAIFARNDWVGEFSNQVAFVDMLGKQSSWTCDRSEFLGRNGDKSAPQALLRSGPLSGLSGAGQDPCCALQSKLRVRPGEKVTVVIALGMATENVAAVDLVRRYRTIDIPDSLNKVKAYWDHHLGQIKISTPDRALDLLVNRWLPYQTIACRLWARAGFYQAGGAYGFRDQLQDTMALALTEPQLAREQIVRASAHQFPEGDVQHWWHPPSGRGVRTHFSDDRVWIVYAVLHYLNVTGDQSVLDEALPFLEGMAVPEGKEDAYFLPGQNGSMASVYEHCALALDRSLGVGEHGLPLMGSGDWNDGMNRVGHLGKGESSWLGWFLIPNLLGFAKIAAGRGELARQKAWSEKAEAIRVSLDGNAWDGNWYRRGFFDDGSTLGAASDSECRIDSIAQSWAVLSGAGDPVKARQGMLSAESYLVRRDEGLILLFTPPFDKSDRDPGYIKGYLPGVRENGGQYTHAALWMVAAFAALGEGDKAAELFSFLNPINHASNRTGVYRYKVEPYVAAADVYAEYPHVGRGGWTWYTGSAGWMLRVNLEWILGFKVVESRLHFNPCIPREWRKYGIRFMKGTSSYNLEVVNPNGKNMGIAQCEVDGISQIPVPDSLALIDDGKDHYFKFILG